MTNGHTQGDADQPLGPRGEPELKLGFEVMTGQPRHFVTTRWSLVIAAGQRSSAESRAALEALYRQYWYPLYAYARRSGRSHDDAADLTQSFFSERIVDKNDVSAADQRRGRFRAWLKTSFRHFLSNDWDKVRAAKRGGAEQPVSLDLTDAEGRYRLEPADARTPDQLYERRWALALLERALQTLKQECEANGKTLQYAKLASGLAGEPDLPHAELGRQLGMTEGAVRADVCRLMKRYRELLFAETAETLEDPEDQEAELKELLTSLA